MLRVARVHVPSHAIAEEVVQETWLAVLQGLSGFEGRSSLHGWVFAILLNRARSRGKREHRVVPFAALRERFDPRRSEPAVAPERFQDRHGERPGWWAVPRARWADPAEQLETAESRATLLAAVVDLPPRQREVLVQRDNLGMLAEEASRVLGVSEGNQRVLLHRVGLACAWRLSRSSPVRWRDDLPRAGRARYRLPRGPPGRGRSPSIRRAPRRGPRLQRVRRADASDGARPRHAVRGLPLAPGARHAAGRVRERRSSWQTTRDLRNAYAIGSPMARAVAEKRMFGGVAFLLEGNMAVGIAGEELMVRVGPDDSDSALERPHTRPFDMTGRPMRGWILVASEGVAEDDDLTEWVDRGVTFARSLPPKR